MESKVAEAMSKKETLKARALSAETTKQLNDSITSMVSRCRELTHAGVIGMLLMINSKQPALAP